MLFVAQIQYPVLLVAAQGVAIRKRRSVQAFERIGQSYLFQLLALIKGKRADRRHTVRNQCALKPGVGKCKFAYLSHSARYDAVTAAGNQYIPVALDQTAAVRTVYGVFLVDNDFAQAVATEKRKLAYACDGCGYFDFCHSAARKCIFGNHSRAVGHNEFAVIVIARFDQRIKRFVRRAGVIPSAKTIQRRIIPFIVIKERLGPDIFDGVGQHDLFQLCATGKRHRADPFHSARHRHRAHIAVHKCTVIDRNHRLAFVHCGYRDVKVLALAVYIVDNLIAVKILVVSVSEHNSPLCL